MRCFLPILSCPGCQTTLTWVANLPTTPHHRTGYSVILSKPLLQHTHRREETLPFYQIGFKAAWKPPTSQSHWGEAEHCPFPSGLVDERDLMQQLVVISRHTGNKLARGSGEGEVPPSPRAAGRDEKGFQMEADAKSPLPPSAGPGVPPSLRSCSSADFGVC